MVKLITIITDRITIKMMTIVTLITIMTTITIII